MCLMASRRFSITLRLIFGLGTLVVVLSPAFAQTASFSSVDITNGATALDDLVQYDFESSGDAGHLMVVLSPKFGLGGGATLPCDGVQFEVVLLWMHLDGISEQLGSDNELDEIVDLADGTFDPFYGLVGPRATPPEQGRSGTPGVQCFSFWRIQVCYYEWPDGSIRVSVFVRDRSGQWHEVWRKEGRIPEPRTAAPGQGNDDRSLQEVQQAWLQMLNDYDVMADPFMQSFILDNWDTLVSYGFSVPDIGE